MTTGEQIAASKARHFQSRLDEAKTVSDLEALRPGIRRFTHAMCGNGGGQNGDCRKKLRRKVEANIVARAQALKKPVTVQTFHAPEGEPDANWTLIALIATAALTILFY